MTMTLISPRGSRNRQPRAMAPRLASLNGLRVGLLSNGKLNADLLLQETARCFVEQHRCTVVPLMSKPFASKPADPELLQELAVQADFMLTGNGD